MRINKILFKSNLDHFSRLNINNIKQFFSKKSYTDFPRYNYKIIIILKLWEEFNLLFYVNIAFCKKKYNPKRIVPGIISPG